MNVPASSFASVEIYAILLVFHAKSCFTSDAFMLVWAIVTGTVLMAVWICICSNDQS
jgi:hypothetical protein